MKVAKFYIKGQPKYMEVVRVAEAVQFDSRSGWVLVQEMDKRLCHCELFWIHPSDTKVEWVREFRTERA